MQSIHLNIQTGGTQHFSDLDLGLQSNKSNQGKTYREQVLNLCELCLKCKPIYLFYYYRSFLFWIMGKKHMLKITSLLLQIVKGQVCLQATAAFHLLYLIARRWSSWAALLPGNNGSFSGGKKVRRKSCSVRPCGTLPPKERAIPSLSSSKCKWCIFYLPSCISK